ncbi:DHHA1 domain-containing protein [Gemmatimonadota bacterium]
MSGASPTKRLYWDDPMLQRFEATVLEAGKKSPDGVPVVLDRTAFYPEGGGQPPDEGMLGEAEVLDVREEEGRIVHRTDRPLEAGVKVEGSINWARRWDHMQQHTGQHLLSRVVMDEFDAHTRGFHLGADETTIDLTIELDERQIQMAVSRANALIDQDIPVTARLVPRDDPAVEAARRKAPDISEVRLVEIEGVDSVPCGGTHVPSTARIGGLYVLAGGNRKVHGLHRIAFVCGNRIVKRLWDLDHLAYHLSTALTTGPDHFVERFEDQEEQVRDLKREVEDLRAAVMPLRAKALLEVAEAVGNARVVMARVDDLPAESLPPLAAALTAEPDVVVLLGAEVAGAGRLVFARGEDVGVDVGSLLAKSAGILGGGGGGAPDHATGGGPRGEALDTALTESLEALRRELS